MWGTPMPSLIDFPVEDRVAFPDRPFAIRHGLAGHPLLSLERLVDLAASLPRDRLEYNAGTVAISQKPEETPLIDRDPVEVVRSIRDAGAWLVMKRVESDQAYAALLRDVLDEVARDIGAADARAAGFSDIQGFIFVSSPNATTPFHADFEDNFFIHIHGEKFFHIIDNRDGQAVPDAMFEITPSAHRNLIYRPEFESRATVLALGPGDGCFVPYQWPHWVRTGTEGYSISMAVTWKSRRVVRTNKVLFMNALLRKAGWPQQPPGRRPAWDAAKAAAYTLARAPLEPLRRSETLRRRLRGLLFGRKANYYLGKSVSGSG